MSDPAPARTTRRAVVAGSAWALPAVLLGAPAIAVAASCQWRISLRQTKSRQPANNGVDQLEVQVCVDPNNYQPLCVGQNTPWPGSALTLSFTLPALYYTGAWTASGTGYLPTSGSTSPAVFTLTTGTNDAPGSCWTLTINASVVRRWSGLTLPSGIVTVTIASAPGNPAASFYVSTNNGGTFTPGSTLTI